jgi:opacity protein-like surface antigen
LARAGAAAGYQTGPLRVEIAATIGKSEIEIEVGDQSEDTKITTYDAILNTYYDLPVDLGSIVSASLPMITPYVGAGVGWTYLDFDEGEGDGGVVAQGAGGLGIRLSPHWTLDTGYRYFYLPRIESEGTDNEVSAHSAEIKVRYRF